MIHPFLRYRLSAYNTHRIGIILNDLPYEERHFDAQPSFLRQCKMFITKTRSTIILREGVESRLAIYSHFCYPHTPEEHQKFIKGQLWRVQRRSPRRVWIHQDLQGAGLRTDYNSKKYDTVHLTIPNVVKGVWST